MSSARVTTQAIEYWRTGELLLSAITLLNEVYSAYLRVRRWSRPISTIGERGALLFLGCCEAHAEIQDFRPTAPRRPPRYAATIAPYWVRGGAESDLRAPRTSTDAALTGGHWPGNWLIYCSGGVSRRQFDPDPPISDVRVLNDSYRLAVEVCDEGPSGVIQTRSIPIASGKVPAITSDGHVALSQFSHIPSLVINFCRGGKIEWPSCSPKAVQRIRAEKLVIPGVHVALLGEEMGPGLCERVTRIIYLAGVARRIMRLARNRS